MKSIPALSWVGLKTRPTSTPNKNASGHLQEHIEALADDAVFVPTPKTTEEPVTEFAPPPTTTGEWQPVAEVSNQGELNA